LNWEIEFGMEWLILNSMKQFSWDKIFMMNGNEMWEWWCGELNSCMCLGIGIEFFLKCGGWNSLEMGVKLDEMVVEI